MNETSRPPGPAPAGRHRTATYRLVDHGLVTTRFTVTPSEDGRWIELSGTCPGCEVRVSYAWRYAASRELSMLPRPASPAGARELATAFCECGHPHAERPAGAWGQGCGAFWQVEVP
ncbi:hypothetical protein AB0M95_25155 [Sphaerisporangium sp. NPDC051017]|uniref:hypothetical protein n=1 Tax=unclassified Sphaerisporangium TaxID=2630420 RepID=UPI003407AAA6